MIKVKQLVGLTLLIFSLYGVALAQSTSYDISWHHFGSGGMVSGSGYELHSTIGQAEAGDMSGGAYAIRGGYQQPTTATTPPGDDYKIYIPLIVR